MSGGLVLTFSSEAELSNAVRRFDAREIGPLETYTPASVTFAGVDRTVPSVMLAAGLIGTALGFGMEAYANTVGYPLNIGGRPEFSWPAFVPIAFEIGVLFAIVAGIVGFLAIAGMLALYDPVDECAGMRDAMRDKWVLAIRGADPETLRSAREAARELNPLSIEEMPP